MKEFFKYLSAGDEDKNWGLYLNVSGRARITPHTKYPSLDHPSGYYFAWDTGRVLQEYQLNYITEGSGILENESGKFRVKEGTLMIVPKGQWHRYRPIQKNGWVENYIGFSGHLAEHYFNKSLILLGQSVIHCGIREEFIDTYYKIFELVQKEEPGFQQIASGLVIKLLGYIIAYQKQRNFSGKQIEKIIQKARFQMRENISGEINLQLLAEDNNIGYSYFRKMFKEYTGISPRQYHLELKIMRAKELLLSTDMNIKEISFELGFQSTHYFSRFFKQKVGVSPSQLKKH
jgi:AraC-like DNA-binding protein